VVFWVGVICVFGGELGSCVRGGMYREGGERGNDKDGNDSPLGRASGAGVAAVTQAHQVAVDNVQSGQPAAVRGGCRTTAAGGGV